MKKNKKAWLISYAFFAWLVVNAAYADTNCVLGKEQLKQLPIVKVSRIIDGDTVLLEGGERVRLVGIDTPEKNQLLADEASEALRVLIAGKAVHLQQGQEPRDKYQRLLAHVFLASGQNVEAVLLQQGFGFLVAIPPNIHWLACHKAMVAEAEIAKRGVWQHYPAKNSANLVVSDRGYQRVYGKLTSLDKRKGVWWLQLEGLLIARITPEHQAYFDWQQLKQMLGKDILISGWVVDRSQQRQMKKYSPLMLLLTHPAHIEVLSRPANAAMYKQ